MIQKTLVVRPTAAFIKWHSGLRDRRAYARVSVRLNYLSQGNFGDVKPVGGGVSELRIDYGPGYRVYLARRGETLVVLLGCGTKRTQKADIQRAKALAKELD
ncbi:MAG: type II toxin-antitoxin system RelE/ParE family toxin [Beijerinckiaceae bacterium]